MPADAKDADALARALAASIAEQKEQLLAAADDDDPELAAELRASVAQAEETLAELQIEQGRPPSTGKRAREDDDDNDNAQPPAEGETRCRPSGPYRPTPTDFGALAEAHPPLRAFLVERRRRGGGGGGGGRGARRGRDDSNRAAAPTTTTTLDFTDWRATRELTAALLCAEYGVTGWSLPEGRLVPPVPNREAYLCWIADLLALSPPPPGAPSSSLPPPQPNIRGLDLGCGASLIYCLLGAAGWGWRMRGVDADASALVAAAANARAAPRALAPLLELARADDSHDGLAAIAAALGPLGASMRWSDVPGAGDGVLARALRAEAYEWRGGEKGGGEAEVKNDDDNDDDDEEPPPSSHSSFAFCVCNPPFFESEDEGGRNPRTACGGTAQEMACPGGEAAFVASVVADSAALALEAEEWWRRRQGAEGAANGASQDEQHKPQLPPTVHWYSTMVGKKTTLKAARAALHELMRAPLPDDPPRARVTAVRTTTLAPQLAQSGGNGEEAKSSRPSSASSTTTRWCIAWTFAPSARGTESRPLPARDPELVARGAWLLSRRREE